MDGQFHSHMEPRAQKVSGIWTMQTLIPAQNTIKYQIQVKNKEWLMMREEGKLKM